MIDLQGYCGIENDDRIGKPWSAGGHTLATNGHIIIRVKRRDDVPENEKAPPITEGCGVGVFFTTDPDKWEPVPPAEFTPSKCSACRGTGFALTCPECYGDGEVCFENEYSDYEFECQTCQGQGQLAPNREGAEAKCHGCGGTGETDNHKSVKVGQTFLADKYLSMVGKLPGVEIGVLDSAKPVRFRFNGGDGLIMPRSC